MGGGGPEETCLALRRKGSAARPSRNPTGWYVRSCRLPLGGIHSLPELLVPPAPCQVAQPAHNISDAYEPQPDPGAPTRMGERAPTPVLWGQMGAPETTPSWGHMGVDTTLPPGFSSSSPSPSSSPSWSPPSLFHLHR